MQRNNNLHPRQGFQAKGAEQELERRPLAGEKGPILARQVRIAENQQVEKRQAPKAKAQAI
eukprot:130127-Pyramimonas_sp.AAC.1